MPKKRKDPPQARPKANGVIEGAGEVVEQRITRTLEENYMPYAMSVILSRAIPEIDGFKPAHRKLLYTMYKMGLLGPTRTKSANIVGQTMKLNPHGDAAIYDTMVRLSRGYEALLHPYIDSKGNFGKFYSRDMAWAASRYTEARLDDLCKELFSDIDKDTVDFVDNYDNTLKEPTLLPASFPSVLVNANTGIAVGMASSICPFNLAEVCQTTIAQMRDPDRLMQRLYKLTPLEDSFSCNFNVLIAGVPRVLGVGELLQEWTAFRIECVRRRTHFDLSKKRDKLHLLKGLQAILLDIDKAVSIVRNTEEETEVVPNLMIGFGIDEVQAEYVAEIKLRHLNREYILKRTEEVDQLEKDIAQLQGILDSKAKVQGIIIKELQAVAKQYGQPRRTMLIYSDELEEYQEEEEIPDYPVHLFFTRDGYFKKITPQSLRMSGEQKLKEGDMIVQQLESTNNVDLLFFTDKAQVYKAKASDFGDTKASVLGEYIPAKLGMDEGENALYMAVTKDYSGYMLFFFENGKVAKVSMDSYATKTNRRKLLGAYSDKSPAASIAYIQEDCEFLLASAQGRMLLMHTGSVQPKTTRNTQGVAAMTLRKGGRLLRAVPYVEGMLKKPDRYRKNIPALGALPTPEESEGEQMTFG